MKAEFGPLSGEHVKAFYGGVVVLPNRTGPYAFQFTKSQHATHRVGLSKTKKSGKRYSSVLLQNAPTFFWDEEVLLTSREPPPAASAPLSKSTPRVVPHEKRQPPGDSGGGG